VVRLLTNYNYKTRARASLPAFLQFRRPCLADGLLVAIQSQRAQRMHNQPSKLPGRSNNPPSSSPARGSRAFLPAASAAGFCTHHGASTYALQFCFRVCRLIQNPELMQMSNCTAVTPSCRASLRSKCWKRPKPTTQASSRLRRDCGSFGPGLLARLGVPGHACASG